ncbi:MAG: UDP-N-acetylglucosamine--LPS N-acetylglucosamine transferase [Leptolyngbyaceae cyanobacterium T60_A2020_046]|nr:UDP-N-acetylglucosamine--LPS N-acetylglucosamine transferase [Leptolyngbyaceae cyanobacterium T60_A2020_046]
MTRPNWLIYALGGGWGHLTRSLALARAARAVASVHLLTNSPYVDQARAEFDGMILHPISAAASRSQVRSQVERCLHQTPWDSLIVDTFPRGLGGELADLLPALPCPKILVQRYLCAEYGLRPDVLAFIASQYDRVLVPGDPVAPAIAALPQTVTTAPWLIRAPREWPTAAISASALELAPNDDRPLVLILASGTPTEWPWFEQVATALVHNFRTVALRGLTPHTTRATHPPLWRTHYPAIDLLGAAKIVIGGGGYNTVYECWARSRPLVARPCPRLYDRQAQRIAWAQAHGAIIRPVETVDAVLDAVAAWLAAPAVGYPPPPWETGVTTAIAAIQQCCDSSIKAESADRAQADRAQSGAKGDRIQPLPLVKDDPNP